MSKGRPVRGLFQLAALLALVLTLMAGNVAAAVFAGIALFALLIAD